MFADQELFDASSPRKVEKVSNCAQTCLRQSKDAYLMADYQENATLPSVFQFSVQKSEFDILNKVINQRVLQWNPCQ